VISASTFYQSEQLYIALQATARLGADELDSLDPVKLAPRRPAWDLKEELAPVTEQLDLATKAAIAELVRDK